MLLFSIVIIFNLQWLRSTETYPHVSKVFVASFPFLLPSLLFRKSLLSPGLLEYSPWLQNSLLWSVFHILYSYFPKQRLNCVIFPFAETFHVSPYQGAQQCDVQGLSSPAQATSSRLLSDVEYFAHLQMSCVSSHFLLLLMLSWSGMDCFFFWVPTPRFLYFHFILLIISVSARLSLLPTLRVCVCFIIDFHRNCGLCT